MEIPADSGTKLELLVNGWITAQIKAAYSTTTFKIINIALIFWTRTTQKSLQISTGQEAQIKKQRFSIQNSKNS